MINPAFSHDWPDSWRQSYQYDQMEMFGCESHSYVHQYRTRFNTLIKMVNQWLPRSSTVLDVAAAQGNFSLTLAEQGYRVTWNDLRHELAAYVKMKYEKGAIEYHPGNILEQPPRLFDGVVISEIIEHVAHPDRFLRQVANMVAPGGFIFLSTPLGSYLQNKLPRFTNFPNPEVFENQQFKPNADGHIFLLYKDELEAFAKNNALAVKHTVLQNNFFTAGHFKTRFLHKLVGEAFIKHFEALTQNLPLAIKLKIHTNISMVLQKA
jgi:2-polyprenyl-3-methyl-5-hydroxy-6-metoxy-1,4-benzoquinol methylase